MINNKKLEEKINQLKAYLQTEYCRKCGISFTISFREFICPICDTKAQYLFNSNIYEFELFKDKIIFIFEKMLKFEKYFNCFITFNYKNELKIIETELKTTIDLFILIVPNIKRRIERDNSFIFVLFDYISKIFLEEKEEKEKR